MKAQSNIKPIFAIDNIVNGMAEVNFYENVIETKNQEGEQIFEFDYYMIKVNDRPNLKEMVLANYDAWLELAKSEENKVKVETDKEKLIRLEVENKELEGVVYDLTKLLLDKGVIL